MGLPPIRKDCWDMDQISGRFFRSSMCLVAGVGVLIAGPLLAGQSDGPEPISISAAAAYDTSPPLAKMIADAPPPLTLEQLQERRAALRKAYREKHPGEEHEPKAPPAPVAPPPVVPAAAAVEQTGFGMRPALALKAGFDGLGASFAGPRGATHARNPSDNSLAVGPEHIVQIVNSDFAVYAKDGHVLQGPVSTRTIFAGFPGECGKVDFGDAVVRYDQIAKRWVFILPIFQRPDDDKNYAVCYAVSAENNPMGRYHRYEFTRSLFPDYPRPGVWPDGYYLGTSSGDTVIQKLLCVAERRAMLKGQPAREQCSVINGVNFLNPADIEGTQLPPRGAPNLALAAGGTQLKGIFDSQEISYYSFHADWMHPEKSKVDGPFSVAVAPYHYLCNGQLTSCVPQPGTQQRLDAQGDKLMQRVVYRRRGSRQSIVAAHSVNAAGGGGGVRWYEFQVGGDGALRLNQQGTFAPKGGFRWLPSISMDRTGDIVMGYSFGDSTDYVGQRLTGRRARDKKGAMTLGETVLAKGAAAQTDTLRWEDYTTMDVDPVDDCTFWYVGDYFQPHAKHYSTRIGSVRLPECR
jgi:hypothetical protein